MGTDQEYTFPTYLHRFLSLQSRSIKRNELMDTLDTPPAVPFAAPTAATMASSLLFRTETTQSRQSHQSNHSNPHSPTPPANATHSSPNRSPRRLNTDPDISSNPELRLRVNKRIVVCCDGTWQDGIGELSRSRYTNVLRLARSIHHEDARFQPPIPQIVYYQSGIGTEKNFYSEYIEGTTGGSLADKVEEAYAFVAHNFNPGDEIFLFGFSRGAYTARMVAMLIGEFGVLDRKDMDHFAKIFICYQKLGKTSANNEAERAKLRKELDPWCKKDAKGKARADCDGDKFTIKCMGVFDTVGSVGIPESLRIRSAKTVNILGMQDNILGAHVERAYQALALNEERKDFMCNRWEQTEKGRKRNQVLRQCWFPGSHSDVGGGYPEHDLADLSLVWMAAQVEDALGLDIEYMANLPRPVAPWGKQKPHKKSGIFALFPSVQRPLPSATDDLTHEYIHPSVHEQSKISPHLSAVLQANPDIVGTLFPLEEGFKMNWPFSQDSIAARTYSSDLEHQMTADAVTPTWSIVRSASKFTSSIKRSLSVTGNGRQRSEAAAAGLPSRVSEDLSRKSEGLPRRSEDLPRKPEGPTRKSEDISSKSEDETQEDVAVVRVSVETNKLKKIRRRSSPLPSISVVAGH